MTVFFFFREWETAYKELCSIHAGESGWLFILEDEYRALEPFHDINYPFRLF